MFGIDDIGLLLGAMSLIYAVVHDTTKVAHGFQLFANFRVGRLKLIDEIRTQRHILNSAVTRLLEPLLSGDEIEALCSATSPLVWTNSQLTTQLQKLYNSNILAVFELARLAIAESSLKFLHSVGVDPANGLGAAGLSPLQVLDKARTDFNSRPMARFRYATHASSIREYFKSIRKANQDIHHAMSFLPDHEIRSRQASQNWLTSVKNTRRSANRLHEALLQHNIQCDHLSHRQNVYLALSSSGSWSESCHRHSANIGAAQRFDLLLEAPAQLTPARALICSSDSVALPDDMAAVQIRAGACILADNSLPLPMVRRGFRANINDGAMTAISVQAVAAGTTDFRSQAPAHLPSNKTTLLSLLPLRDRLSDLSRVTVASNIADSVAHLAGTPWLTPDVSKSDIAFFENPNSSSSRGPALTEAYLGRDLHQRQLLHQPPGSFSSIYYQTMALKMSIWFLELCAADDRGHDSSPQSPLLAIIADAFTWLGELRSLHDVVFLDAALGCLQLTMDPALSFTDRDKDLEDFRSKVIEPLRAADKALHPVR